MRLGGRQGHAGGAEIDVGQGGGGQLRPLPPDQPRGPDVLLVGIRRPRIRSHAFERTAEPAFHGGRHGNGRKFREGGFPASAAPATATATPTTHDAAGCLPTATREPPPVAWQPRRGHQPAPAHSAATAGISPESRGSVADPDDPDDGGWRDAGASPSHVSGAPPRGSYWGNSHANETPPSWTTPRIRWSPPTTTYAGTRCSPSHDKHPQPASEVHRDQNSAPTGTPPPRIPHETPNFHHPATRYPWKRAPATNGFETRTSGRSPHISRWVSKATRHPGRAPSPATRRPADQTQPLGCHDDCPATTPENCRPAKPS